MPYFLLIDENDMQTLIGALNFAICCKQKELGTILMERIARLKDGETKVVGWKAARHDELLHTISQLGSGPVKQLAKRSTS